MSEINSKEGGVFVPNDVIFDHRLNPSEKLLFSMALNLNRIGSSTGCYANNRYFSDRIGVSPRQVRRMILKLQNLDLIERGWTVGRNIFTLRQNLKPVYQVNARKKWPK